VAPERFKARLVAKGFSQRKGVDYGETFAPTARLEAIRLLFAVSNQLSMNMVHFDIKTAYLHGIIKEEIYMRQPEAFHKGSDKIFCKLKRSLYGLEQAGRAWNDTFTSFLSRYNLRQLRSDPCLFVTHLPEHMTPSNKNWIALAINVDDGLLCCRDRQSINNIQGGTMGMTYFSRSLRKLRRLAIPNSHRLSS